MKVMLLNPPTKFKVSKDSRWPEFTKSGTLYYPFWLGYATVVLKEDGRHLPMLVDAIAKDMDFPQTVEIMKKFQPDLLVIDTSTSTIYRDVAFVDEVKKAFPEIKTIFTGRHPTAMPDQTFLMSKNVDFIARQEYDYTVLDLANTLDAGGDLKNVSGLSWRNNGLVVHNEPRPLPEDLDKIPFVSKAYKEFLNVWDYRYALARYPMIQIWTSRGCPARCVYCDYPQVFTMHGYRTRSARNVVDEMEWIQKNLPDVKEIFFEDDTFTIDNPRVHAICDEIISRRLKFIWSCNVRANVPEETLKKMKDAGCRILIVGYESGNQNILNKMKKGIILKQAEEFTRAAQKHGLKIFGCFMLGLPGDTRETIEDTFQFAKKMHPDMVFFQQAVPFPGTEFYQWLKMNGYMRTNDFSKWLDDNGRLDVLYDYPGISGDDMASLRDKMMLRYYLDPKHIFYTLTRNMHPHEFIRVVRYATDYLLYLFNRKMLERKLGGAKTQTGGLKPVKFPSQMQSEIEVPVEAIAKSI